MSKPPKPEGYKAGSEQNVLDGLRGDVTKLSIRTRQQECNIHELLDAIADYKRQFHRQNLLNDVLRKKYPEAYYGAIQEAFPEVTKIPEQYRIKKEEVGK